MSYTLLLPESVGDSKFGDELKRTAPKLSMVNAPASTPVSEYALRCKICGDPIQPNDPNAWQAVHAWERVAHERSSGKHGGNDFRNAKPLQQFAHAGCLYLEKRGLLGQEQLV